METPRPRSVSSSSASSSSLVPPISTTPKADAGPPITPPSLPTTSYTPSTVKKGILRKPETPSSTSRVGWGYRETNTGDVSKISSLADSSPGISTSVSIASHTRQTSEESSMDASSSYMLSRDSSRRILGNSTTESSSRAVDSSFAASSNISTSQTTKLGPIDSTETPMRRNPWETPRSSTLKLRAPKRDISISLVANMSSEQTNQSVLFDASLHAPNFTAAFPSPRRKGRLTDTDPTPRPEEKVREQTSHQSGFPNLVSAEKQLPRPMISASIDKEITSGNTSPTTDGSFSMNESLWKSEGEKFLKRFEEVEREELKEQQKRGESAGSTIERGSPTSFTVETSRKPTVSTVQSLVIGSRKPASSPVRSQPQDESLPSWMGMKTPKPIFRVKTPVTPSAIIIANNSATSVASCTNSGAHVPNGAAGPPVGDRAPNDDGSPTSDAAARQTEIVCNIDGNDDSLSSEKGEEMSFSTPGAIERSMSFSYGPSSKESKTPLRDVSPSSSRRTSALPRAPESSPGNLSFATAFDPESSPTAAELETNGSPRALQDVVPPASFLTSRQSDAPSRKVDSTDANLTAPVLHSTADSSALSLREASSQLSERAESDALLRLSAVRSALEEFTTAQAVRLGTLCTRLEQDQSEASRLRSLLLNELQSRVALEEELNSMQLKVDILKEERIQVHAAREQERKWVGERDEELLGLVKKLEQQLERRYSALSNVVAQSAEQGGENDVIKGLRADLEQEKRARAAQKHEYENRLAAAASLAPPSSCIETQDAEGWATTPDAKEAIDEAERKARASIERDHDLRIYKMEREHEAALDILQDQIDRLQKESSVVAANPDGRVDALEAELRTLEKALRDSEGEKDAVVVKQERLVEDLSIALSEKKGAIRVAEERLQIINDLESDIGRFHGDRAKSGRELERLKKEESKVEQQVVGPLRREVEQLQTDISSLRTERAAVQKQRSEELEVLQKQARQLEQYREEDGVLIQQLEKEKGKLNTERQTLIQSLADLEQVSSLQDEKISQLEQALSSAREQIDSSLEATSSEQSSLRKQISSLQDSLHLASTTEDSLQSRLLELEEGFKTLTARNKMLAQEASETDLKRLKLQKANEVLYSEFEKTSIALETKQLELEMFKRKTKKTTLPKGQASHIGDNGIAVDDAQALKIRLTKDVNRGEDLEDLGTSEVLLERGPNPLRARGRRTMDPWAQQQATAAVKKNEEDEDGTPMAKSHHRIAASAVSTSTRRVASSAVDDGGPDSDILSRRTTIGPTRITRNKNVLRPSGTAGNISDTRVRRPPTSTRRETALTGSEIDDQSSVLKHPNAALRRTSNSSLSTTSSLSSRSKHSIHDSRTGRTGTSIAAQTASSRRRESATATSTSSQRSEDEPMSLEELQSDGRTKLTESNSGNTTRSSLTSRSLATRTIRSIENSQLSYMGSGQRFGNDGVSSEMSFEESDPEEQADHSVQAEGFTPSTHRRAHRYGAADDEVQREENDQSTRREQMLNAKELKVPRQSIPAADRRPQRISRQERELPEEEIAF